MNFKGWVFYLDGDMVCNGDLKKLWELRNENFAVQVVKHNYKTKMNKKYFGNVMKIIQEKIGLVLFFGIVIIQIINV